MLENFISMVFYLVEFTCLDYILHIWYFQIAMMKQSEFWLITIDIEFISRISKSDLILEISFLSIIISESIFCVNKQIEAVYSNDETVSKFAILFCHSFVGCLVRWSVCLKKWLMLMRVCECVQSVSERLLHHQKYIVKCIRLHRKTGCLILFQIYHCWILYELFHWLHRFVLVIAIVFDRCRHQPCVITIVFNFYFYFFFRVNY